MRRFCFAVLVFAALSLPVHGRAQPALEARGQAEFDIGHGTEAIALWRQALAGYRAARDANGELRVLERLGTTASLIGRFADATGYFTEARDLARRSGNAAVEADVVGKLARAAYQARDFPRAAVANREVLARAEAAGDAATGAVAAAQLGQALLGDGRPREAAPAFRRAAELFHALGHRPNESAALQHLGLALRRQENYVAASDAFRHAAKVASEAREPQLEADALHGLGVSMSYLGDYAGAIDTLKDAIRIARRAGDRSTEAAASMSLGNAQYFLKRTADAVLSYEQVLSAARALRDRQLEGQALGNLALALAHSGQYDRAAEYFRQDIAIARERGDRLTQSQALGNFAAQLSQQGRYSDAIALLQQSRDLARAVGYRRGEAITLRNLGYAQLRVGDARAAESSAREAIAVQETLRSQTSAIDRSNISLFETHRDAYRILQAALVAQSRTEAALEASELGRARALADLLARRSEVQPAPLSIEAIRSVARTQRATLVEYSVVPEDSAIYAWVVRPDGIVHFRRSRIEMHGGANVETAIADLLREMRSALGASAPSDVAVRKPAVAGRDDLLAMFHRLLIAPLADLLPRSPEAPVVLVPQGALFLLPFAALRDDRGRALIDAHSVAVAPSIQALSQLATQRGTESRRSGERSAAAGRAVVVGNPAMPEVRLGAAGDPVRFDPLPAAEREANAVAALLGTRPLLGAAASKEAIVETMPGARVIHLATHGIADDVRRNGAPGALVLAASGRDDGLLTTSEISALRLQADLVVLSACNTGLGDLSADGVVGLSRAFLAAGAHSVVVSLWSVPDQPTAELMEDFHRRRASAKHKVAALREAMLATRARHPDPVAWAGFILMGESR